MSPSWKLHRKWAERMGIPGNIASQVDKLIDVECGHHDIGRSISMRVLPFDTGPRIKVSTLGQLMLCVEEKLPESLNPFKRPLVLRAILLHHLLDSIARAIAEFGSAIARQSPEVIFQRGVDLFRESFRADVENSLDSLARKELERYLSDVFEFVRRNIREIVSDIAREVDTVVGPEILFFIFNMVRINLNLPGLVWFFNPYENRPLPIRAAFFRILRLLRERGVVEFCFGNRYGCVSNRITLTRDFLTEIAEAISNQDKDRQ